MAKYTPERDLRCILLATLVLAGVCLGAAMFAGLAVCPAAFGDMGDLLFQVKRYGLLRYRNLDDMKRRCD